MVQYQPARILTGNFHKATFTGTIFMKSGNRNSNLLETGAGLKPANVKNVPIIKIARGMGFITGMKTKKMYWFAIMKK